MVGTGGGNLRSLKKGKTEKPTAIRAAADDKREQLRGKNPPKQTKNVGKVSDAVTILVGGRLKQKKEDRDKGGWSSQATSNREVRDQLKRA